MTRPRVLGLILAGGRGERLHPLTQDRSKPAVPFGSKYRIVDFVLSNFVNSRIFSIYILVQYKSQSLIEHIRRAWRMSALLDEHFIVTVPPQMRWGESWYRGTADAVFQNLNLIRDVNPDLVAIFGADHVYRINLEQMVDAHLAKRADVTVAALPVPIETASGFGIIDADADGRIIGWDEKPVQPPPMVGDPGRALSSMGNYIFSTDVLEEVLVEDARRSTDHDFGRTIIPELYPYARAYAYDFLQNEIPGLRPTEERGYWRDVGTIDAYWRANMDLLGETPALDLSNPHWPILGSSYAGPSARIVSGHRRRFAARGRYADPRRDRPALDPPPGRAGRAGRADRGQHHHGQYDGRPQRADPAGDHRPVQHGRSERGDRRRLDGGRGARHAGSIGHRRHRPRRHARPRQPARFPLTAPGSVDDAMTDRWICVHGHFYQPPRESPWLEAIEIQDSASPYHDWNDRITAECYAPNGAARLLDADRRILAITNNYARISFNIGPTLFAWMERAAPEAYARILDADRESRARCGGHGNAIAQAYNHMIMPLATARDKRTQVAWGIADFRHRFGRDPEGMWLPETAVDTETLEAYASAGIAFTILAPHQAARVRPLGTAEWIDVSDGRVDPKRPYLCRLPSGRTIALFFYDGPISHSVAFEGLLNSGEGFANRLAGGFADRPDAQLVHVATDGESYGHHHRFGEMALAAALRNVEERQLGRLTNYGEYLARYPPDHEVEIAERTSWSCAHGVERWRSDCGCRAGHPGWTQAWRAPLRDALDWLRDEMAGVFERVAGRWLRDPWAARDAYINVVLARTPEAVGAFFAAHARPAVDDEGRRRALEMLEMQRHAMLMYTSCGWFFDDLSGIETVQVIKYAARALQLAEHTGARLERGFVRRLAAARSNLRRQRDGATVYRGAVRPSIVTLPRVVAHYGMSSLFESYEARTRLFSYTVDRHDAHRDQAAGHALAVGLVNVTSEITGDTANAAYAVLHLGGHDLQCGVRQDATPEWYEDMRARIGDAFLSQGVSAALRLLDDQFDGTLFVLADLFVEERRKILGLLTEERLEKFEGVYRDMYEESRPLLVFMRDSDIPIPPAFLMAAQYTLTRALGHELRRAQAAPLADRAFDLAADLEALGLTRDWGDAEPLLREALVAHAERLRQAPLGTALQEIHRLLDLADALGVTPNLWQVQNLYHAAAEEHHAALRMHTGAAGENAPGAPGPNGEFWRLGDRLHFNLDALRAAPAR